MVRSVVRLLLLHLIHRSCRPHKRFLLKIIVMWTLLIHVWSLLVAHISPIIALIVVRLLVLLVVVLVALVPLISMV